MVIFLFNYYFLFIYYFLAHVTYDYAERDYADCASGSFNSCDYPKLFFYNGFYNFLFL